MAGLSICRPDDRQAKHLGQVCNEGGTEPVPPENWGTANLSGAQSPFLHQWRARSFACQAAAHHPHSTPSDGERRAGYGAAEGIGGHTAERASRSHELSVRGSRIRPPGSFPRHRDMFVALHTRFLDDGTRLSMASLGDDANFGRGLCVPPSLSAASQGSWEPHQQPILSAVFDTSLSPTIWLGYRLGQ